MTSPDIPPQAITALRGDLARVAAERDELRRMFNRRGEAIDRLRAEVTEAVAAERERCAQRIRDLASKTTALPHHDTAHERDQQLFGAGLRAAADLLREQP